MNKNKLIAPFLKWVGGKRQLVPAIVEMMPKKFTNYYEPFVGGGAVLFHTQPKKAVINDLNEDLINVYRTIKNNPEELIADLRSYKNEAEHFYDIRILDRTAGFENLSNIKKASRVIYLNKTCYNGLYRVNNSGEFNSPFGRYKNPNIVNDITIKAVSKYLNKNQIKILNKDYEEVLKNIEKGSFVYFDPPYHPVSKNSNFTGYVQGGFGMRDQIRLRGLCDRLDKKGIKFMLSNSAERLSIIKVNGSINFNDKKQGKIEYKLAS